MTQLTKQHGFERLLHAFLDADRLKRAKGIKDDDLRIEKKTDELVEAAIKDIA